jgi:RNA polymerase sigma-70 factor (ECF subfamily)
LKEEDVEDVMQEAYIKGFEKLHQFRREARFSTWLSRIVINCALQHLNKLKGTHHVSIDLLREDEMDSLQQSANEIDANSGVGENLKKALESAIAHLPAKYRIVFILREIEHIAVADVAATLQISEENVKVRLHRAKNMLKDMLRAEVRSFEIFAFHASRCADMSTRVMSQINAKATNRLGNV